MWVGNRLTVGFFLFIILRCVTASNSRFSIINSLSANSHRIETSQLICSVNQLTGFYMMTTLAFTILSYIFPESSDIQKQPSEVFCKEVVIKNFANFTGKHLWWSLFLINLQAWGVSFIKRILQHRCFPVKFAKFLRIPILKNFYERLLLYIRFW